jgi:carbon monoxide dehydrogenase subunit G
MELTGERSIPAPRQRTWEALNDPEVLKACIAGCESLERDGADAFVALVAVRVGPVSARFKGQVKLTDMLPPRSYTIHFDGQGGAAGFGKGSADVVLDEGAATATLLKYSARAQVGGRIAQVGSRLVDAAAAKVTGEFFDAFEARLRAEAPEGAALPSKEPAPPPASLGWWIASAGVLAFAAWLIFR